MLKAPLCERAYGWYNRGFSVETQKAVCVREWGSNCDTAQQWKRTLAAHAVTHRFKKRTLAGSYRAGAVLCPTSTTAIHTGLVTGASLGHGRATEHTTFLFVIVLCCSVV